VSDTRNPIERLGAVCTETEEALAEFARLARREQDLRHDIRLTRIHVDDILNSRTWRALELYRKARIRAGLSGVNPAAIRAAVRRRWINRPLPRAVRDQPAGINVAGYLDAESGMGEAARASIRSIEAAGLPVALNNVPSLLRTRDASYRAAFVDTNPHPFNLIHLNGDNMPAFAAARGRRYFRDHYTIGYWFWELSTLRPDWAPFAGYVDEVWTATRFVRDAVSAACTVPTVRMPLPIVLPPIPSLGRAHFNLPEEPRVFLYIFDVSSQTERKNPVAAIRAFRRAGLPHDDAVLVLKFTNPEYDRAGVRRLHEESAGLNVVFLDAYLDRPELCALVNTADCYLSPHRAEGFGLTLLEAMRLGKPVIGTAYSGNMDFMTAENSYPLDYSLVTLTRDYGPYFRGAVWADPDVDHAARLIRQVVEHPSEAADRGGRARADVEREWNADVTGRAVRDRLEAIRAGRRIEIGA
jgi:glycosyltransferase involved in cell wall biosynthesis